MKAQDPTTEGHVWFMVAKDVALALFPDMAGYELRPTLADKLGQEGRAMEH